MVRFKDLPIGTRFFDTDEESYGMEMVYTKTSKSFALGVLNGGNGVEFWFYEDEEVWPILGTKEELND